MIRRDPFHSLQPSVFIPVIRDALTGIKEIQMAFVFGSSVRGDTRADSDIDVMTIGDEAPLEDIGAAFLDMEIRLDRAVHLKSYTPEVFARKYEEAHGFVLSVVSEPRIWLIGSEHEMNVLLNHTRILSSAERVLGSREDAVAWLSRKNWGLGGMRPIDLIATDAGLRRVDRVLQQIQNLP